MGNEVQAIEHVVVPQPDETPFHVIKRVDAVEAHARFIARHQAAQEIATVGQDERIARAKAEADVVDAARRSQAEIRRHVQTYLKEELEPIVAGIVADIAKQMTATLIKGLAGIEESQAIRLDDIAAGVRRNLLAFAKGGCAPKLPEPEGGM